MKQRTQRKNRTTGVKVSVSSYCGRAAVSVTVGEELIEHHAEAPDIWSHWELALSQGLGRIPTTISAWKLVRKWLNFVTTKLLKDNQKPIWPEYGALSRLSDHVVFFVLRQNFGKAKISNLHPQFALHENIPRCQISVNVAPTGQVLHSLSTHKGENVLL